LVCVTIHATSDSKVPFLSLILADLEHKFSSLICRKMLLPFAIRTSTATLWWQIPFVLKSITHFNISKLLIPLYMQGVSYNSQPPNARKYYLLHLRPSVNIGKFIPNNIQINNLIMTWTHHILILHDFFVTHYCTYLLESTVQ